METGWIQVITIIGANLLMILTSLGITITLWVHANKRVDDLMKLMHEEMKDFHARLCVIESKRHVKANE